MRVLFALLCAYVLTACISTVPHTTAKALPAGRFIVEPYAGALAVKIPNTVGTQRSMADSGAAAPEDDAAARSDAPQDDTDQALRTGLSARVGVAERVDLGLTAELDTGLIADLKVELFDFKHAALALDAGAGWWFLGLVQAQVGVLADAAAGPVRATAGLHYARMLGAVSPRMLSPTLAVEVSLASFFALVPQVTGYLPVGPKDTTCHSPYTDDLNNLIDQSACDASQTKGVAATMGLRFSFGASEPPS